MKAYKVMSEYYYSASDERQHGPLVRTRQEAERLKDEAQRQYMGTAAPSSARIFYVQEEEVGEDYFSH
jgi:hypothetical protein